MRRFLRTPKGLMTAVLVLIAAVATAGVEVTLIAPVLLAGAATAAAIDAIILRVRSRRWMLPSGAALSGLFVAMVLSPHERWHVVALTAAVATLSKYVLRGRTANVFNPAALAIVVTYYLFNTGQDWWGALADVGAPGLVVLLATGAFITDRVNKAPLVLAFLAAYFALFTTMAFAGEPRFVAEIFRSPDINAVLFFAFFILTDPPTSPTRYRDQIACGVLVAIAGFAVFELIGAVHYLLSGVLVGNVWEAVRRRQTDAKRTAERLAGRPRPAGPSGADAPAI